MVGSLDTTLGHRDEGSVTSIYPLYFSEGGLEDEVAARKSMVMTCVYTSLLKLDAAPQVGCGTYFVPSGVPGGRIFRMIEVDDGFPRR